MLDKTFDPAAIESGLYDGWERGAAFAAEPGSNAQPFTIMIPPPNVTGSLHMGHALTMTLQDTLIRWQRMKGRDALWQPGTDHAGIATQMVVERLLDAEGTTRQQIGRDAFTARVWQWKAESGGNITRQLRRLGASLDWPRERFTMDDGLSRAVRETFVTLHDEGLIYRDRRLVNWDPKFRSAISDLEVESREVKGTIWHIRYPLADASGHVRPGEFLTVATTRPETLLGDTAVAVHPDDDRYRALVGHSVVLPLTGRRVPVIADAYSDPEKGTGAVKITPAHDFNDFAVGQRHGLPMPSILDRDARVVLHEVELHAVPGVADPAWTGTLEGQDRFAARAAIVAELERLGLLDRAEPHPHQVPHGDRSGVPIEPLLTTQWYCNAARLAEPVIAAVERGDTVFAPRQWENTFFAWMRDIQPWCISRQLWWGHRIPAWYGPDGHVFVARLEDDARAQALAHYGEVRPLEQDPDVLDTWFSSALWPFSTLGWPEKTADLARYYPGDVLVTGFDIIFFWVARMMMMGVHLMGEVPFRTVAIHGLVRDEKGEKMSKSKGNVIDPLVMIDRYGADALRFAVVASTGPGRDVKLGPQRIESNRTFVTKLWNAARFCEMNGVAPVPGFDPGAVRTPLCRWITDAARTAALDADAALEAFRFADYGTAVYRFTWHTFCDWFLEFAKPIFQSAGPDAAGPDAAGPDAVETRATASHVLGLILRLLHPAMPFVTEHLWDALGYGPRHTLVREPWPAPAAIPGAVEARAELDWVVRLVSDVRTTRNEMNVPNTATTPILLRDASPATLARAAAWSATICRMARGTTVAPLDGPVAPGSAQIVIDEATVALPLAGIIDLAAEKIRLDKARAKAAGEADKLRRKLENPGFTTRAAPDVVEETRERLVAMEADAMRLDAALARLEPG